MKNLFFVFTVIIATISVSSCGKLPKGVDTTGIHFFSQTNATDVTFIGTVTSISAIPGAKGIIINHTMVPVAICDAFTGEKRGLVFAYFADADYKTAMEMNEVVEAGKTVKVVMEQTSWFFKNRFRIISFYVEEPAPIPVVITSKPAPVVKKSPRKNRVQSGGNGGGSTTSGRMVTNPCNPCGCCNNVIINNSGPITIENGGSAEKDERKIVVPTSEPDGYFFEDPQSQQKAEKKKRKFLDLFKLPKKKSAESEMPSVTF